MDRTGELVSSWLLSLALAFGQPGGGQKILA